MPSASTRSVPGTGCRCSPPDARARSAVGVRRGSITTSRARRSRCPISGGIVSADVRAGEQHDLGVVEVGDRERQPAVDAERPVAGRGRRRHAEPAVVVDLRRAQRDAGELAQQVGLLVGQPAGAEHGDGVRPVLGLQRARSGRRRARARRPSPTGASGAERDVRSSGVVSRSGCPSSAPDVQPFWHSPPRLVGNSRRVDAPRRRPTHCPHCRAQYGQWVATARRGRPRASHARVGQPRVRGLGR